MYSFMLFILINIWEIKSIRYPFTHLNYFTDFNEMWYRDRLELNVLTDL